MRWAAVLLLLYVPSAMAQTPKIALPETVTGHPGAFIRITATTDGKEVRWFTVDEELNLFPVDLLKDSRTLVVTAGRPGRYLVVAYTASGDVPSNPARCVVMVAGPSPPVPPPVPPVPPTPPVPPPSPAPIPDPGLRVLILYDASKQAATLPGWTFNKTFTTFLDSKCIAGPTGQREWRIWPTGADFSSVPKLWQDAVKRPHPQIPWLLVSDGKSGYEGPLPADEAATTALIGRFGDVPR